MARKETVVEIGDYDEEIYHELKRHTELLEEVIRLLARSQISPS